MAEWLGIVAAVIAIGSFTWALFKKILPNRVRNSQEIRNVRSIISFASGNWQQATYSSKNLHIISYEDFQKVMAYRHQLKMLTEDERLFLFVCSIVHGLWGEWIPEDIATKKVIVAASMLTDGRRGWRPVWRSAYIIEKLSGRIPERWQDVISDEVRDNSNFAQVEAVISTSSVVTYLEGMARGKNTHLVDKSYALLQEIDSFDPGSVSGDFVKSNVPD